MRGGVILVSLLAACESTGQNDRVQDGASADVGDRELPEATPPVADVPAASYVPAASCDGTAFTDEGCDAPLGLGVGFLAAGNIMSAGARLFVYHDGERVWLHDRLAESREDITAGMDGYAPMPSFDVVRTPVMSRDGRFVAFVSTGAVSDGTTHLHHPAVWLRDGSTGVTTLVSLRADGSRGHGELPSLAGDGSLLAFRSADALTADDTNDAWDLYVYEPAAASLRRISGIHDAAPRGSFIGVPEVSANGRFVTYAGPMSSDFADPYDGRDYLYTHSTQSTEELLVPAGYNAGAAQMTAEGHLLLWGESAPAVWERGAAAPDDIVTLAVPQDVFAVRMSEDGRYVVFVARPQVDAAFAVYVHDRILDITRVVPQTVRRAELGLTGYLTATISADGSSILWSANDPHDGATAYWQDAPSPSIFVAPNPFVTCGCDG